MAKNKVKLLFLPPGGKAAEKAEAAIDYLADCYIKDLKEEVEELRRQGNWMPRDPATAAAGLFENLCESGDPWDYGVVDLLKQAITRKFNKKFDKRK